MGRASGSKSSKLDTSKLRMRPAREKKSRKIFDPADHESPPIKRCKRSETTSALEEDCLKVKMSHQKSRPDCRICGLNGNKNGPMFKCSSCNRHVHSRCIDYSDELAKKILTLPTWQCVHCKYCSECHQKLDEVSKVITCESCDFSYHLSCHQPQVKGRQALSWKCHRCTPKMKGRRPLVKSESPTQEEELVEMTYTDTLLMQFKKFLPHDDVIATTDSNSNDLPDVREWSTEKLITYFKTLGFSAGICSVFQRQEIDGLALMLLEKDDVLTSLGLTLGPAIKVYEQIKKLQHKYSYLMEL